MNLFPWSIPSFQKGVSFLVISGPDHIVTIKHVISK